MANIARMRTINECAKELKILDSESAITEWFIRTLVKENKIKYFMAGKKVLVNYDDLLTFLNFEKCEASHA